MTLEEQLVFCKQCKKKKFDNTLGLICSLTMRKPDFEESCINFEIDPIEAQRMAQNNKVITEKKSNSAIIWSVVVVILIVVRIILRMARD